MDVRASAAEAGDDVTAGACYDVAMTSLGGRGDVMSCSDVTGSPWT